MDDKNRAVNPEEQDVMEVSLLDLAVILVAQRWFIAKVTTAFAVVAIIYALLATPIYKSTIQIMPPAGGASGAAAVPVPGLYHHHRLSGVSRQKGRCPGEPCALV